MECIQSLIESVDQADSSERLNLAVRRLAQSQAEDAIPALIKVLGYNNPGAAIAAVDGLIQQGERVVPYLLDTIDGYNYGARAWATRVFAGIGDPRALDLLIEAAQTDFSLSVRRAAAKGLGNLHWKKVSPQERLTTQQRIIGVLNQVALDPEWVVRYAAIAGLERLGQKQLELVSKICQTLGHLLTQETELIVQRRIIWAQQRLG